MIPLLRAQVGDYDYLKYSTPTSGNTKDDKVIFLAFKKGERDPALCIKSTRTYAAKEVVVRGFENLKKLNAAVEGSAHEGLFPKALSLHDDGSTVYSVETAAAGQRERLSAADLERVVRAYTEFQSHVAERALRPLDEFARELLPAELYADYDALPASTLRLPRALQLGDLTEDNLLISEKGLMFVDFDRVGKVDLPGFDLYSLLRRFNHKEVERLCEEFLPGYFSAIRAEGGGPYDRLLFLCQVIERGFKAP